MPINGPAKVLVVDDHAGIRAGISSLINGEWPYMRNVGVAASADEALSQVKALQPDVVVLDVNLAGQDGLVLIAEMRRLARCEIVVLTCLGDPRIAAQASRLGAHGYVHKTAPAGELLACISSAHARVLGLAADDDPPNAGVALSHAAEDQTPSRPGRER